MLNRRKNLLKIEKCNRSVVHLVEIRALNKSIKNFHQDKKRTRVRGFVNGSSAGIWKAVGAANDLNPNAIPNNLTVGGQIIDPACRAGAFALYFSNKIKANVNGARVNANEVYNGKNKLIVQNRNFMTENDVKLCMNELSSKKCEGFDRIPVCVLYDARETLLMPMCRLFNDIYHTCKIPEQCYFH